MDFRNLPDGNRYNEKKHISGGGPPEDYGNIGKEKASKDEKNDQDISGTK